jgi:hypothetical protein
MSRRKERTGLNTKPKTKLSPAQHAARLAAEKALLQRRYCEIFDTWRSCRLKPCHRVRACRGDAKACLKRALAQVPREVQWQARQDVLKATSANAGAPERQARQLMPRDL